MDRAAWTPAQEKALLTAARAGDELAFGVLTSAYRPGLEVFCRLMLGCPHAARTAVCETLLRGWGDLGAGAPSASARVWLYRLATEVCVEDLGSGDEFEAPQPLDGRWEP